MWALQNPVLQLMHNKSAAMQNTKIEQSSLLHLSHSYIIGTEQSVLFHSAVNTVSKNTQKSLLYANMVALLQLTALCPITAHMFQYQLHIKSAKLLSALISLNDVQNRALRRTNYVANVMGISPLCLQMACLLLEYIVSCTYCDPSCQWHWHMQICVFFVLVVTFKYLNPASPVFFHACNGKFVWICLWQTCTEKLQLWGSTTHLYQKSQFHPRKLWSYDDLSANTRIYSYNQQSQISAHLPFTITQYTTQFYKICSW